MDIQTKDQRSWIKDQRSGIRDQRSEIRDHGSRIRDHGSWIMNQRSWIRDHILFHLVSVVVVLAMQEAWRSQKTALRHLCVGRYGGGDEQRTASTLLQAPLSQIADKDEAEGASANVDALLATLKSRATQEANKTISGLRGNAQWADIVLVDGANRTLDVDAIEWEHLASVSDVSSLVDTSAGDTVNLMLQGWVCDANCASGERLGSSNWPLIGVFGTRGLSPPPPPSEVGQLDPFCGWQSMNPADQHAHWVDEIVEIDGFELNLSDWHFGSDMARLLLDQDVISTAWVAAIDPKRLRGLIVFLVLVRDLSALPDLFGVSDPAFLSIKHLSSLFEPLC